IAAGSPDNASVASTAALTATSSTALPQPGRRPKGAHRRYTATLSAAPATPTVTPARSDTAVVRTSQGVTPMSALIMAPAPTPIRTPPNATRPSVRVPTRRPVTRRIFIRSVNPLPGRRRRFPARERLEHARRIGGHQHQRPVLRPDEALAGSRVEQLDQGRVEPGDVEQRARLGPRMQAQLAPGEDLAELLERP